MKKNLKKLFSVVMIFGIFISSFPISPLIQKVNALANVSGDKIIETAMTYGDWSYDEVGTCTGLVTRTLNKLGVGTSIVGIHPYNIDTPQPAGTGARYAPAAMYNNAMNHPEDAVHIWSGYIKDVRANASLFQNGDLVIQRPEDKANYTGSGHVGLIHIYNGNISMYGANGSQYGVGDAVMAQGVATRGTSTRVNGNDYIHVFRLIKVEPEYASLTSKKSSTESVKVSFYKSDKESDKPISGVEVDFYRDGVKFASGVTDSTGYASATSNVTFESESSPKKYVTNYNQLDNEDKAKIESNIFKSEADARASADEEAQKSAIEKASQKHNFTVIEVKANKKYWLDPDNNTVSDSQTGSGSISVSLNNIRTKGIAKLKKVDKDATIAQNEATLDDALYGLYARNNILDPADGTIIYNAGTEITRVRTVNGEAEVQDLYLGDYYWKELTPSDGYKLSTKEEDFSLTPNSSVSTVTSKSLVKEEVISGDFKINKVIVSGDKSEVTKPEEGAEFIVVAKKYVEKYGSIEEAYKHKDEFTEMEYDHLVTSKNGEAKSKRLSFGTFVIKQIGGDINTNYLKDSWEFVVKKENQDTINYVVSNSIFRTHLKLVKKDADTEKTISVSNTTFKIKNLETNEYIKQKINGELTDEFTTGKDGSILLPEEVKAGKYKLEEIKQPNSYLINEDGLEFAVNNTNILETDKDGNTYTVITMYDKAIKGIISIKKTGEVLTGVKKNTDGNIEFIYEEVGLSGMKAEIVAAEDIKDPATGEIIYAKNTVVDIIESNEGYAESNYLPLGKYIVTEIEAPEGMILDKNNYKVELTSGDNKEEIVFETVSITNKRQKLEMNITKLDKDEKTPIEGVVFGLYAKKDISLSSISMLEATNMEENNSKILVKAGTLIETAVSDKDGKVKFKADLPLSYDKDDYYEIKELETIDGYYDNNDVVSINSKYNSNADKVKNNITIYNEAIKNYILVNKVDSLTMKNIISKDFNFNLCEDYECNKVVKNYSANTENGTALIPIRYGTWYIKEKSAPQGYAISSEIVKVSLNEEGLFINDTKVETDEDLTYSIIYQNSLLPVIQTGYNDNPTIYIIICGTALIIATTVSISFIKKKKRK